MTMDAPRAAAAVLTRLLPNRTVERKRSGFSRHAEDPAGAGDAGLHQVHEAHPLEGKEGGFRAGEEGGNGEEEDQEAKFQVVAALKHLIHAQRRVQP